MDIHPQKTGGLIPYLVKGVFEKRSYRQGNPCEYALQIKLSENDGIGDFEIPKDSNVQNVLFDLNFFNRF